MRKLPGMCVLVATATAMLWSGSTLASSWINKREKAGIVVEQRPVEGSKYFETRGSMNSRATLFSILAVLKDTEACVKWLYECKQGETLKEKGAGESTVYLVIDAPLLLKDRDMFVHSKTRYFPHEEKVTIELSGDEAYKPPVKKRVRVLDFAGTWHLKALDDGQIAVSYQVYSNPQVAPAGPANKTMVESVFDTLKKVDRLAQSQPYRDVQFSQTDIDAISIDSAHP